MEERSGLKVSALAGNVRSDHEQIDVPDLLLQTPNSEVRLTATIPWSSLEDHPQGSMKALLNASLGKEDLLIAAGSLPEDFKKAYPDKPLAHYGWRRRQPLQYTYHTRRYHAAGSVSDERHG